MAGISKRSQIVDAFGISADSESLKEASGSVIRVFKKKWLGYPSLSDMVLIHFESEFY